MWLYVWPMALGGVPQFSDIITACAVVSHVWEVSRSAVCGCIALSLERSRFLNTAVA